MTWDKAAAVNSCDPGGETAAVLKQHLIDPEFCLGFGSCLVACSEEAIQTDENLYRYVIDPDKCNGSHHCLEVCSSDAIKSWHMVPADRPYSVEEQIAWQELPPELELDGASVPVALDQDELPAGHPAPATASVPVTYCHTLKQPLTVTVKSNTRVTDPASDTDVHHIVLEFGDSHFPWLEGQNIGVIPPGTDASGRAHHMRAYSIASCRECETPGSREMALTIKRVVDEWDGKPYFGVASNYMCDLKRGDAVRCIGPIGEHFLMPQDARSRIMMICSGTGIAPMRSFIQQRQRLAHRDAPALALYYGGRTRGEMAYVDELDSLPTALVNTHLALSRSPDEPKRYVQEQLTGSSPYPLA